MAHEEAVQENGGGGESDLRQLEHDTDLQYEIDALAAGLALLGWGEAREDGGREEELFLGEEPL